MTKRVLDVGQCGFDHGSISGILRSRFAADVDAAGNLDEALQRLENDTYDLVLVNRKLDRDGSDGLEVIRRIRGDSRWGNLPMMLVSNYQESQEAAVREGALPGFGKSALESDETIERLSKVLG